MDADGWGNAKGPSSSCGEVHRAKAYLVASGQTLSIAGGRLLDRILTLGPRFTLDDIVDPGASPVVCESAAILIDFLCEIGVLRAREPDGTYVRTTSEALLGSVSCVVCGGRWPIGSGELPSLPRSICLAPSFLVILQTLRVVGICPACRVA